MKMPTYPAKETIYSTEYKKDGTTVIHNFGIGYDDTDHFHFRCPKCKDRCIIVSIKVTMYRRFPEVYFDLHCPDCKLTSTRKVWVGDTPWRKEE